MTPTEKKAFLYLFIQDGYVMDLSTSDFDALTTVSVGVAICHKYQMSKGRSLTAFCNEASLEDVIKIFSSLMEHYEFFWMRRPGEEKNKELYQKCKSVLLREQNNVKLETPAIVCVNRDYIIDISSKAIRAVDSGDYDSAITKARSLLEEVFCYVIEQKGEIPSDRGDIKCLYKQVKDLYNMHAVRNADTRINTLLSGFEKIVTSIGEMRNVSGDAHGIGNRRILVKDYHARLYVNAALTMADFILSVESHNS